MPTNIRPCIICSEPSCHDCDEMICGYLCARHLDEWSPDGGYIQDAWERYGREHREMPR